MQTIEKTLIDISERGKEIYEQKLRAELDTPENAGKFVFIDVETGAYEIETPQNIQSALQLLRGKNPDAFVYSTVIRWYRKPGAYAVGCRAVSIKVQRQ